MPAKPTKTTTTRIESMKKLTGAFASPTRADSKATLVRKLSDPYVKAIRYAADRIGEAGVVCYVNNDSFVAEKTFDGMRKHLAQDFDLIYVLELGGNVRKNPTLSGTTHNVFGIQVGVSINLFIRLPKRAARSAARKSITMPCPSIGGGNKNTISSTRPARSPA